MTHHNGAGLNPYDITDYFQRRNAKTPLHHLMQKIINITHPAIAYSMNKSTDQRAFVGLDKCLNFKSIFGRGVPVIPLPLFFVIQIDVLLLKETMCVSCSSSLYSTGDKHLITIKLFLRWYSSLLMKTNLQSFHDDDRNVC